MAKAKNKLDELVKLIEISRLAVNALGLTQKAAGKIAVKHGGGVLKSAVTSFQKILAGRTVDRRTLAKLPPELLRHMKKTLAGK